MMRVAVVQLGYDDAEPYAARVERAAARIAELSGHDLAILPELWGATGFDYGRWDALAEGLQGPWVRAMADAARAFGGVLHAGSFVERLPVPGPEGRWLANTSVVFSAHGELLTAYRKIHRFGFGSGEPKLMEAGTELAAVDLPTSTGESVRAALSTCYDLRFPELYRAQVDSGAEIFLVPAAWPQPRVQHWSLLGRARALENQCVLIACNTAGTHAGTPMGGHSQVVLPHGEVLAELAHAEESVLSVEIDLTVIAQYRAAFPVLADRRL